MGLQGVGAELRARERQALPREIKGHSRVQRQQHRVQRLLVMLEEQMEAEGLGWAARDQLWGSAGSAGRWAWTEALTA